MTSLLTEKEQETRQQTDQLESKLIEMIKTSLLTQKEQETRQQMDRLESKLVETQNDIQSVIKEIKKIRAENKET